MNHVYLDAAPIVEIVDARGGIGALLGPANRSGSARKYDCSEAVKWDGAFHKMRRSGRVTVWAADRFCVKVLGTLPELVYGDAFFVGCDEEVSA